MRPDYPEQMHSDWSGGSDDISNVIGEEACNHRDYCDSVRYIDWEQNVAKPLMEKAGYTNISFYMVEKDSFGPLIRGVRATKEGKNYKFFYG